MEGARPWRRTVGGVGADQDGVRPAAPALASERRPCSTAGAGRRRAVGACLVLLAAGQRERTPSSPEQTGEEEAEGGGVGGRGQARGGILQILPPTNTSMPRNSLLQGRVIPSSAACARSERSAQPRSAEPPERRTLPRVPHAVFSFALELGRQKRRASALGRKRRCSISSPRPAASCPRGRAAAQTPLSLAYSSACVYR